MSGRKLKEEYENPIDNILIKFSIYIGKILSQFPIFTPNVFTTLSLIISIVGTYYVYNKSYKLGAILIFIGYFFDCLDGNFARAYNMVTDFGDKYDHISDIVKFILLLLVFIFAKLKKNTKILLVIVNLLFIFSFIHLGCQEQYSSQKTVLDYLKFLCSNKKNIVWTRYLGVGTGYTILCLYIYNLKYINKLL